MSKKLQQSRGWAPLPGTTAAGLPTPTWTRRAAAGRLWVLVAAEGSHSTSLGAPGAGAAPPGWWLYHTRRRKRDLESWSPGAAAGGPCCG
ncbi:hypothetical protein NDU88_000888 [Pleurodeles waltl]|uniref:Uncharacterized protein n=1 Tax=Pleurodeles waltl TaxID=8319 RepID=A0AAV7VVZ7_PLEWA|nr:hypothetical protein NDU88_000888 [Pleurodeles waltl]